jgi:peptide/nickel transport system substrate-binding protein
VHQMKRRTRVLAGLSVLAIVAVASCGDDDNASTNTTTPGTVKTATTTASSGAATTSGSSTATTGGGSTATTAGGSTATSGATGSTTPTSEAPISPGERTSKDEGQPAKGGALVYGLEADTANGWAPYRMSCATSCYAVMQTVSDPLFWADDKGQAKGMLIESVDHNADSSQWTLHVRKGIKFQDGTPLDGNAVKFNLESCQYSPLTGFIYAAMGKVTASGQDVVINGKGGPWQELPGYLTYSGCDYMFSPKWLGSLQDVPQRNKDLPIYDAALAATPANGDYLKPVGLGPFTFQSYTPGNGNSFKAVRNDNYWRGPNGVTGEQLPYLDSVELVVAVDEDSRMNGLRSGQTDLFMSANGDTISQFLDDNSFKVDSTAKFGDTAYIMLNTAEGPKVDPKGVNAKSPLLNIDCRKALAGAIDLDRLSKERTAGLFPPANGPFPPGSAGYLKDTGYPKFDVPTAQAEMDKCLAALKTDHIEFSYNTTNDPFNVESNTLVQSMWTDAFGNKVQTKITPIEQGQYIGLALTGAFQAQGWRSHNGLVPDQQNYWWRSGAASPIGTLGLNFGRFQDPVIDKAFDVIHTSPDPATRQKAAEDVNREFGAKVWNLWTTWVLWAIIQAPYVNGLHSETFPDGTKGVGLAFLGRHQLAQMWCSNGKCE